MILTIGSNKQGMVISLGKKSLDVPSYSQNSNQQILIIIDKLIKDSKISFGSISKIIVDSKNSSFTGVRVAVSIANALSQSWGIPISSLDQPEIIQELIVPTYNKPANITRPKPIK